MTHRTQTARRGRLVWVAAALLWTLFIWHNSMQIAAVSGGRSGRLVELLRPCLDWLGVPSELRDHLIRKLAHMTEFGVLAFCWSWAWLTPGRSRSRAGAWTVVLTALTALCDETIQLFVPGRAGMVRDVLIDCTGGLLALGVCLLVDQFLPGHKKREDGD